MGEGPDNRGEHACPGDFRIINTMTHPTFTELGDSTTSKLGVACYTAPELLNPLQFGLTNNKHSKGDIESFAVTAYEVRLSLTAPVHHWHSCFGSAPHA